MMPPAPTRLERALPASADDAAVLRRELVAFLAASGGHPELLARVELAAAEALNNVVMHAYRDRAPGAVHLQARLDGGALVLKIADDGVGLVPRDDSPGCGYGLGLMAKLADRVCVSDRRPGTEVVLHFAWPTG